MHTLGCKLNYAESSAIAARFESRGFVPTDLDGDPDLVIVNSCTVTENADRECRQIVRRALRANPEAVVAVTGCYAQLKPEQIAAIEGVSYVLGADEKHRAVDILGSLEVPDEPAILVAPIDEATRFEPAATAASDGRTRSFLKVQDGCDYLCTFCTIPKARGGSRSRDFADAIAGARQLVADGYREIVLTGVNTGDYRGTGGEKLIDLLRALHSVDGLDRLRISSIEPNLLTDEIVDLAAVSPIMVPHFHIPLQSGSDEILGAMRRRYRSEYYRRRIETLASAMEDVGIGVDVIVGFPGETEEEFETTRRFLSNLPISYLHVFPYSEREGTIASTSEKVVPQSIRRERVRILRELSTRLSRTFSERFIGTTRPVLVESIDNAGNHVGYTDNYVRVTFDGGSHPIGSIVDVELHEIGERGRVRGATRVRGGSIPV